MKITLANIILSVSILSLFYIMLTNRMEEKPKTMQDNILTVVFYALFVLLFILNG